MLETVLESYPKEIELRGGFRCDLRPLAASDHKELHAFFEAVPPLERMFIKHRVSNPEVIAEWCAHIDLGRILPLLAVHDGRIIGDCSLHQHLGGWKRHIGRVSVLIHPEFRGRGLARALVLEIMDIASQIGLEKIEAEFIGDQQAAVKMFSLLGFKPLLNLPNYVKDMQTIEHDYVLMGADLKTDEEYASAG